jgi:hypothetical protein
MGFKIEVKGLDKLQRKLKEMPSEMERIRRDILKFYGNKIEHEAKEACPTSKLKESVKVVFKNDGSFNVKFSPDAKEYVEPVIQRNTSEMRQEIIKRIGDAWEK